METPEIQKSQTLSELAEANRILTGLETAMDRKTPACCMITSAVRGEGKTTLTAGLGRIAARRGDKRILMVDLNWYSSSLHNCFGLSPEWDLKRYSQVNNPIELIRPSGVANLDILTAPASSGNGAGVSPEKFGMARTILKQVRDSYDLILVDTASMFPANRHMNDPVVLGNASDAVILVVLTGVSSRQQVKRANVILESSGAKLVGVVANHWKIKM